MNIEEKLREILVRSSTLPFLFLGSGISRRYLKTDDWENLLKKFAIKDINYYKSLTNNDYPTMGSKIAEDFFENWWENPSYVESRSLVAGEGINFTRKTDPLKYEIAKEVNQDLDLDNLAEPLKGEVEKFKEIKISGVITTNYDLLIENVFDNKFKKYIGQEEMLFNKSYEVGEIYKIHGCCTDYSSIVITAEDYDHFEKTNLFLTSKLLSFFIDYPIIFMGYSFNDTNIHNLLSNILKSIGEHNVDKLKDRIVFVEWIDEEESSITETIKSMHDINLPITHIKTNSFMPVFNVLASLEEHLPVHIVRQLRNRLYEIIKSDEPTKHILVKEDDFDKIEDMEVIFGVGVVDEISKTGYSCLKAYDLFKNLIVDEPIHYNEETMISDVAPNLLRNAKYLPVYQYLSGMNINSSNYTSAELNSKIVDIIRFSPQRFDNAGNYDFLGRDKEIIEQYLDDYKSTNLENIDLEIMRQILKRHLNVLLNSTINSVHQGDYKKLCCLYDKLKYGW